MPTVLPSGDRDCLREDAAQYSLFWYEEAWRSARLRFAGGFGGVLPGPCHGENLFSHQDARNLLRYGGMRPDRDWLQFDCALSTAYVSICGPCRC